MNMNSKLILMTVLCIVSGIAFIIAGMYFLSKKFIDKLNESTPSKTDDVFKHNVFRSKGCGFISLGLGALTIVNGIMISVFPPLAVVLSFVYMIMLIIAFIVLTVVFR